MTASASSKVKRREFISTWLKLFQSEINPIAKNDFLIFTAEIWEPNGTISSNNDKVTINCTDEFPFLDMELFWDEFDNNKLAFQIHRKRNQPLKYLNNGSSHTPSTYKAIPQGVCQRLTKLTTVSDDNKDRKLDDIYPDHFEALNKAKLLRNLEIPTLGDSKAAMEAEPIGEEAEAIKKRKKRRARDRLRSLFFCVGYTDIWPDPIHVTLNRIKKRHLSLCWLRITMSYHRFTNLREMFQGDMSAKLLAGITSRDFKDLDCNCRDKNCKIVIYEAERLKTGMKYLGNTQQFMNPNTHD